MVKIINDANIISDVINLIDDGNNLFITGGGGVGKSYLLNKLKEHYKNTLAITSTTGISALNVGGQTLHSWSYVGICDKPVDETVHKIYHNPIAYKKIILAEKLAIDEISMLDNLTMDYISNVLKKIRENEKPFGGIQIILVGDFFQLPPVGLEQIEEKDFCFKTNTWKELDLTTVYLKKVHRQKDIDYINALNNIRIGKTNIADLAVFYKRDVEPNLTLNKDLLQIFPTNASAEAYNKNCFNEIDAESHLFVSTDYIYKYEDDENGRRILFDVKSKKEFSIADFNCMKMFDNNCKALRRLELKVGCRVMLLKNLDTKKGLVNGSCGTVSNISKEASDNKEVIVKFDNGLELTIQPAEFSYQQDGKVKIERVQIPLTLAYAITVHKSQGMTFDNLVVNMDRIFDYGQAYVALSRTKTLEGLTLKGFNHNLIAANDEVVEFYTSVENSNKCIIVQ